MTKIELLHNILSLKQLAHKQRKTIEVCKREKTNKIKRGTNLKIADFTTETLKPRRAWSEVFQARKETNFSLRTLYLANLYFKTIEK
jgi:hypothetical protein